MKIHDLLFLSLITGSILSGCSNEPGNNNIPSIPPEPTPNQSQKMEIKINPSITQTKATDNGFESGDCIGLYVVNYNGNTPGSLQNSGNHVDNMRHTYSGVWTPDSKIYWADNATYADIYMYYPYTAVSSVSAMPFLVKADQSNEANYKASDLMIGKASNITPTESAVSIVAHHVMSRISISIEAGNGFTNESLAKGDVTVKINGIRTEASVNIANASVSAAGNPTNIIPFKSNGSYRALLVPQTVESCNLITVTVDGKDYNLQKGFTFEGGKNHNFTVTLSKTSTGVNVTIGAWDNDGTDNGGTAE